MFRKFIFFATLVTKSGAEGMLFPVMLEVWILIFQGSTSRFLSQLRSTFHFRHAISQLLCIGPTLGRQNSCCFGLPGCKMRLLLLYFWGLLADLNACNPYLYSLDEKYQRISHRNFLKAPFASMPAWFFHLPVMIRRKKWRFWHGRVNATSKLSPDPHLNKIPHIMLTLYDMLWRDGLLFRFVANLIGFGRYKVNEFSAAVHHQLPGIVGHPDIGESLFDHLIDSSSGYSEIIIIARWRSHRIFLSRAPTFKNSPVLVHYSTKRFQRAALGEIPGALREGAVNEGRGGWHKAARNTRVI